MTIARETLPAGAVINLHSTDVESGWIAPQPEKYLRLPQIDQLHAESLALSCYLSADAKQASRVLAFRSLLQGLLTSLPLIVADFVTMYCLFMISTTVVERFCDLSNEFVTRHTALIASILLIPIGRLKGLYPAIGISPAVEFRELVQSCGTSLCIFFGIGIATASNWPYYIAATLLTMVLVLPVFPAVRYTVRALAARCSWWGAPLLIYGSVETATELFRRIGFIRQHGLRPVSVLLSSEDYWLFGRQLEDQGIPVCDVRQVLDCALKHSATWILIGDTRGEDASIRADLNALPNRVMMASGGLDCGIWDRTHTIGSVSGLWFSNSRHCASRAVLKRLMDIVVTAVGATVLSPLLFAIAFAIRLSSPGPIFYCQKRLGYGGRTFYAWKFRSMVPNADRILQEYLDSDPELRREWDLTHKLKNDPRVTWIGRLIRATSLDELPQLWNILVGDMSIVGPRPIVNSATYDAAYVNDYPNEYAAYCSVRPGLTGLWQVTCRNSGVYEMRIYWDMYYIRNWSIWLDLYIILRTIRTVVLREGAS